MAFYKISEKLEELPTHQKIVKTRKHNAKIDQKRLKQNHRTNKNNY